MSTRVEGATIQVTVTVRATLSAGPVHLTLSARRVRRREPGGITSPTALTTVRRADASQG